MSKITNDVLARSDTDAL